MEKLENFLKGIQFGDIDQSLQSQIQSLAYSLEIDITLSGEDPLFVLFDWYQLEKNSAKQKQILATCKKIIAASSVVKIGAEHLAKKNTNTAVSLDSLFKRAQIASEKHGFRCYPFEPEEKNAQAIVKILNSAIKNKWEFQETEKECNQKKLSKEETAFVLSFAQVYWPAFEMEANLRESPKDMISYLSAEKTSNLGSKGYCSYWISVLAEDGTPAGFATGGIGNINRIFERFGLETLPQELTITFVGYVALGKSGQGKGADMVLLEEVERLVEKTGHNTDYFLSQVDRPLDFEAEVERLQKEIAEIQKNYKPSKKLRKLAAELEEAQERVRAARLLVRLWEGRYGLCHINGLKSMEIIHDYSKEGDSFPIPEKQPQLELLIRPSSGADTVPLETLKALIKGLYLYYNVEPGCKVVGSNKEALEEYVNYSLENVKVENGAVKLSSISN